MNNRESSSHPNNEAKKSAIADRLVRWFQANKRDLPWRRTNDPYKIWVSEIMLQQTRVDTVIPYYERFIGKFPTIAALAAAEEADLLKAWEGLGYYSRVRNMQAAARTICELHDGEMPDNREQISKLKGIGPYTAGAVLSIAYGRPESAVDGNVLRVISRLYELYDDIAKPATRTKVEQLVAGMIPEDAAGDFNQSLMELGALICTPRSVRCTACPVSGLCSAYAAGTVDELPVKTKAKKPRYEERAAYIIEGTGERHGMVLLKKRPDEGLLARMWELPNEPLTFDAQQQLGLDRHYYMEVEHVFSHIRWSMKVYLCTEDEAHDVIGNLSAASDASSAAVAETASAYDITSSTSVAADHTDSAEVVLADHELWATQDSWREVALPNVFVRILEQYFSGRR